MLGLFWTKSFPPFFALMLVHSLFYVPTISVANSIAFANLKDPAEGVRPRAHGRHHRLDPGLLAVLSSLLKGQQGAALQRGRAYIFLVAGDRLVRCWPPSA